ncbi:hypothetical protein TNCV_4185911 [Trichonephila clavipes]|nr:hypothetical protein TNCV_4185911 [Trichonephila clavipes]
MSVSSQPAYFAHANVFHHDGKPVPIELSIPTIPMDGSDPESADPRQQGSDGGQRSGATKKFQELGLFAMVLKKLPKFKDICDGTFPNPVHECVHEEEDISCCTTVKFHKFAKYLQKFNKLHAEWSFKVTVLTQ